ncbi:MAG: hypothetical protein AB9861_17130 [Methanosarcina sp.]
MLPLSAVSPGNLSIPGTLSQAGFSLLKFSDQVWKIGESSGSGCGLFAGFL